jgi:hypothetical protein
MLKSYTVTFRGSPTERLSAYTLDEVKGLDNALAHALNLIRAGHQDVAIQDGDEQKRFWRSSHGVLSGRKRANSRSI